MKYAATPRYNVPWYLLKPRYLLPPRSPQPLPLFTTPARRPH